MAEFPYTVTQYLSIINRGGDDLRKLNLFVANYLDSLILPESVREKVDSTPFNFLSESWIDLVFDFGDYNQNDYGRMEE